LLVLEDRRLLTSFFDVFSAADDGSTGTLRWAVGQANSTSGAVEIDFTLNTPATITLTQGQLELTNTTGSISIVGPGAGLVSVSGNHASRVFQVDKGVTATISGLTIADGNEPFGVGSYSGYGGGLVNRGTTTLNACKIVGNNAGVGGGGVSNYGRYDSLALTDCTITGNSGGEGGGIGSNFFDSVTLTDCTISGNSGAEGGGLFVQSTGTVNGCTFAGNTASQIGGGAYSHEGILSINNSLLSGNSALNAGGAGMVGGTATLTGCTVSGNSAVAGGGLVNELGSLTMISSTVSGNTGGDGTLINSYLSQTTLTACTVSSNIGANYSGLINKPTGTIALTDTIVAGNTANGAPSDIGGSNAAGVTGSYNLVGTGGSGGLLASDHNILNVSDPDLGPLGTYGGPTPTVPLLAGSAAIGTGTAVPGVTADQRGFPLDSPPDIGAFQVQSITEPLVVDSTGDGTGVAPGALGLRGAIGLANLLGGDQTITFNATIFANEQTITLSEGQLELNDSTGMVRISGPSAGVVVSGGGAYRVLQVDAGASATISGLSILGGYAAAPGGGVLNLGTLDLMGCTLAGNTGTSGGGMENQGTALLTNCSLHGNSAAIGGGLDDTGMATLVDTTVDDNVSDNSFNSGAGVSVDAGGTLMMTGGSISGNVATHAAGIYDRGSVDLSQVTIAGNTSFGNAGGVDVLGVGVTATLTDCTVSGNVGTDGAGLDVYLGTATLTDTSLSGNTARNEGGGLFSYGHADLTDCTLSGNSAAYGGGLFNDYRSNLIDCTISGNSASQGGGLLNYGTASLIACTVSGNSAAEGGGGLYNFSPPFYTSKATLTDTIVAGNTSGGSASDIGGDDPGHVTGDHNLIGPGGSGGIVGGSNGNIVLSNLAKLGLAPLGDYGGPTPTMPLLPGSAAIHAGVAAGGVTTDQRGFPLDSPPDIGAFQVQPGLVVNTNVGGVGSPSGDLSLREALNLANTLPGNSTITFDATVFHKPQTIELTAGQLELSKTSGTTKIVGPAAGVTVDAGGLSRVFQVDKGVTATISGLTIAGGSTLYSGGGLYNSGTVTLTNCTISGNTAGNGGGVDNRIGATLTMTNGSITGNSTPRLGGGILNFGMVNLTGVTISGNSAGLYGGGLMNGDSGQGEEGPVIIPGTATLTAVMISGNTAGAASGGGVLNAGGSTLTMTNVQIQGNVAARNGAGLYNAGTATLTRVVISGNSAGKDGGGLYNSGMATLTGCTVTGNTAESGGGIYNVRKGSLIGIVILVGTKVKGNTGGDIVGL
jgi:hypothetical protein